jgi:hypothetical protein
LKFAPHYPFVVERECGAKFKILKFCRRKSGFLTSNLLLVHITFFFW